MLPYQPSQSKEVIKLWFSIQVLFQPEHPLVVDEIADLAIRIEQVPELPRAGWTSLHTSRVTPLSHSLDTEGTLVNHVLVARPIAQIMNGRIQLFRRYIRLGPVKHPAFIGTCRDTVPAADTPIVIDNHKPVGFFPGSAHRTNLHAGWVFTVLTLHRHVDVAGLGHERGIIVMLGLLKINKTALRQSYYPDPVQLGIVPGRIVLFYAAVNTAPAPYTPGEVETVSPQRARLRSLCAYGELLAVFLEVLLFKPLDGLLLFLVGHLQVVLLKELLQVGFLAGDTRQADARKRGDGCYLEEVSPCEAFIRHGYFPAAGLYL